MTGLRHASQNLMARAIDYCARKARLSGHSAVAVALRQGNRGAHDYFRYGLAKELGAYLGSEAASVKAVYLVEPEAMSEELEGELTSPSTGMDLIVWTGNGKDALQPMAEALCEALLAAYKDLLGSSFAGIHSFLTVDLVDDRDVEERIGVAALVTSLHNPATRIWSRFVIHLNSDYCGRCRVCANVCPYDAITLSPEANAAKIDLEKCQVCGICYSACPSGAIEASYYDFASLVRGVQSSMRASGVKAIALSCRGSTPTTPEIQDLTGLPEFVSICLPCVGRIPSDFFFKAVSLGIERIAVIPCGDGQCRFQDGSRNIRNRMLLFQQVLRDLNYHPGLVSLHESKGPVATVEPELCTGCGTCLSICPYEAIRPDGNRGEVLFVAHADPALCQGCGACVAACPSHAIELSRFSDAQLHAQIQAALDAKPTDTPHILGFRCNWCSYGEDDLPFDSQRFGNNVDVIRVPCVGRIDPLHVLWAFVSGADGVFLGGCHPDDCRYVTGSRRIETRIATLQALLKSRGFDPRRLQLAWLRRDAPDSFSNAIWAFASRIERLGCVTPVEARL
jgi:coenzyme F420-reducing hydrogenase delta subunit/MinD superfamily P-loop ATPase